MPDLTPRSKTFSVTLLIVLHAAIVLPLAYWLNIWADEASTLYTTQHGLLSALQHAAADEKQAPLYFWILSVWRDAHDSIFFARLFSVICSSAAIKVFADLARLIFRPRAALLATAFFALHPYLIWAGAEIRVYSLVILLTLLLLKFFFAGFLDDPTPGSQKRARVIFLLLCVFALYTNYYLGFILAGLFAALVIGGRWRAARVYLGCMLVAGLAFLPQVWAVKSQFMVNTSGFHEEPTLIEGLRYLWHHFLTYILPAEIFPDVELSVADIVRLWTLRFALLVAGVFTFLRRDRLTGRTRSLAAVTATIFACLLGAYFLVGSSYVELRHASVVFAPLILFAASLIDDVFGQGSGIGSRAGKFATLAAGLVVLVSFSHALLTLYPNMAKRGDWARVGQFIEQNESPGQPIVVFTIFDALALPYHYHGVNQILPDERFFEFDEEAAFGTSDSLKRETDFVISEIPPGTESIWLAVNQKCLITEACGPLENYVRANYTIEKEQDFYLEKLFLLRKKAR